VAGIGFDLRRMCLADQGPLVRAQAYTAAGMIAAGPWLVTMASLWLVRWIGPRSTVVADTFLAIVGCLFAASLITVGGLQMAVTRWLADQLHLQRYGVLVSAFARLFAGLAAVQAASAALVCGLCGLDGGLVAPVVTIYVAISLTWLAMVWLSLVRQHGRVLMVFAAGAVCFAAMLVQLGPAVELRILLWAYALANAAMVAAMALLVLRGVERADDGEAVGLVRVLRLPALWATGTAWALATWIDKLVFWWGDGVWVAGTLPHHPLYDSCFYLGYVTVVPALAANLVHLETEFYDRYRAFYAAVTGHGAMAEIRRCGAALRASLDRAAGRLLRVQGVVTALCCWFAPEICAAVGLPPFAARTLRFLCLGSLCHVLLLLVVLVLLYFDRQRAALRTVGWFLVGNAALAAWSLGVGPLSYGLGYALAALVALVWGVFELRWTLARLEYLTFTGR